MKATDYIADFDSAAGTLRALSNYLKGEDFPLLGAMPRSRGPLMKLTASAVNRMPSAMREQVYIWSGWMETVKPKKLREARAEQVAQWITGLYPRRKYPAMAIGSSNGAATHLWAALGIPWLPQTFLMPVARSGIHPDDVMADIDWAQEPARWFLENNPEVQLHHMHDPNQDRLMVRRLGYFRVKCQRLGAAYERFLLESLEPRATIFLFECELKWPTRQYGPRHYFQFGALGGLTPEEYHYGSPRVEDYLRRYRSPRTRWEPPAPDAERPEAEWGFEPSLRQDVERFANQHGFRVTRIVFAEPEHMSPLVADLYDWWNRRRGIPDRRLLVESFIVMEPYWTVRTGSVPFWMVFNKEPSAKAIERYLRNTDQFREIRMMLFSHGVESAGLVPIEEWRRILAHAAEESSFVGVDERAYPRDFGVFVRYHYDLQRKIRARYPMPSPLSLLDLDGFLTQFGDRYQVRWDGVDGETDSMKAEG